MSPLSHYKSHSQQKQHTSVSYCIIYKAAALIAFIDAHCARDCYTYTNDVVLTRNHGPLTSQGPARSFFDFFADTLEELSLCCPLLVYCSTCWGSSRQVCRKQLLHCSLRAETSKHDSFLTTPQLVMKHQASASYSWCNTPALTSRKWGVARGKTDLSLAPKAAHSVLFIDSLCKNVDPPHLSFCLHASATDLTHRNPKLHCKTYSHAWSMITKDNVGLPLTANINLARRQLVISEPLCASLSDWWISITCALLNKNSLKLLLMINTAA